jgi:hypothetical protein
MPVLIGVDVGQRREPSAICAAENPERMVNGRREFHFLVRYLERLPLGTSFLDVAKRVGEIAAVAAWKADDGVKVFIDATGLGQPIIDVVEAYVSDASIFAVYFTHGDRREGDWREVKLGKAFLVARLQMLLQTGRLHLPKTEQAETLARELLAYEIRVEEDANDRYGAFRVGTRDDLVTALGLAVQDDGAPTAGVMRNW